MALKICRYCGNNFHGRADAKYCTTYNFGRCRVAAHRLSKRAADLGYDLPEGVLGIVLDMDVLTALAEGKINLVNGE